MSYTDPVAFPRVIRDLGERERAEFMALKGKFDPFGWLMMTFTPYVQILKNQMPQLPLRDRYEAGAHSSQHMPPSILDAVGYREFLQAAIAYAETAVSEFRQVLKTP